MQSFLLNTLKCHSRTTAQDALWQHILNRNTSSQPFMTPCARQVMNRIHGDLTPPWAGCWGPLHSMSRAIYLPMQRNRQRARPIQQTDSPIAARKVWHSPTIWNQLHSGDSSCFQWHSVDAVTPEFLVDLQNTSWEYFRHLGLDF